MKLIITKKQFFSTLEFFSNDKRFKLLINPKSLVVFYHFQCKSKMFTLAHFLDDDSYIYTEYLFKKTIDK